MTKAKFETRRGLRPAAVFAAVVVLGAVLFTLAGVDRWSDRKARSAPDSRPIRVVTSLGIFADMAANAGGDAVEVTALVPATADPHSWEPSIRHMRALAAADVFLYNGLGLEPWVERTLAAAAPADLSVVVLSEDLATAGDAHFHIGGSSSGNRADSGHPGNLADADARQSGDPHMWLDIQRAIAYVRRMEEAFVRAAPAREEYIRRQTTAYVQELEELDRWFQQQIEAIPPERRLLMTDHDAYVYMAERYGLRRVGFVTANPDREPSARELAQLVEEIRRQGVPALFAEPHVGTHFIDELARETRIPVGTLYTDAFFGDIRTYVDMMRANGEALRTFLGGTDAKE